MSIRRFEGRYDISLEQALALYTAPVLLESPVLGFAYQVESYSVIRNGPPFATQGGALQLRITGGAVRYADLGSANWLTLVDTAPDRHCYIGVSTFVGGASDGPTHYGSWGVNLAMNTANPTVNEEKPGAPLILVVAWRLLPTYAETA